MNTIKRNGIITGKNSMSYNAKHPNNPIILRPIRDARRRTRVGTIHMALIMLMNCSRPFITRQIKNMGLS